MKYKVTYKLSSDPHKTHFRFYDALSKATALEMFSATCEESLVGESPSDIHIQEVSKDLKNINKSDVGADIDSI